MSTYPQPQRIRLRITFKRILMNLKFPCSLTAQVKHDTVHDSKKLYELRNGQCNMNETIQSEVEAPYNVGRGRFEDKKISINVFMSSSNGKVAAGNISFSLLGKEAGNSYDNVQFLEKCPDKQAKLYYSLSFQLLVGKGQRLDKTIIGQLRSNDKRGQDYHGSRKQLYNSTQTPQALRLSANHRQLDRSRNLNESHVEQVYTMEKREGRNSAKEITLTPKYNQKSRVSPRDQRRSKSRSFTKLNEDAINNSSPYQSPFPARRIKTNDNRLDDREEEMQELQKLKNKIKNLERIDRSNVQIIRETKDEADRKKNKISQLEMVRTQLQETVRIKDEKVRKLQKSNKQLSEQCESLGNQLKNIKTQNDLRQNMSREQLRKLQEKQRQSESERERAAEEYNRSVKAYEEMEKKYQGTIKEKERAFAEEKAKLNKKIEGLIGSIDQAKKEIDVLRSEGEEFVRQKKGSLQVQKELGEEIEKQRVAVEQLQNQLRAQSQVIRQLQAEAEVFKQNQVDRQQLKKKTNQLLLNINAQGEKISKHEKTIDQLQSKTKEQEEELQRRSNDKNQLNLKLAQLKKSYDAVKASQEQKIREIESLGQLQNAASSKANQLKGRLEVQRRNAEQAYREYGSRESALVAEKEQLEGQCEEMRWQLQKQSSNLQEMSQHSRAQNDQIYKLKEELIDKIERIKRLQQENSSLSTQQEHLSGNCTQIDSQRKQQQTLIKELTGQLEDAKKKGLRVQQELADVKQKLKVLQLTSKQKQAQSERKLREMDNNIRAKQATIRGIQQQLKDRTDEVGLQKQTIASLGQELLRSKDITSSVKKEVQGQEATILKSKQAENDLRKAIQQKEDAIDKKSREVDEVSKRLAKLTDEHFQYKNSIIATIQSFLTELLRQDEASSPTKSSPLKKRAGFPDERLNSLELEVIQKRSQQMTKIRAKAVHTAQEKQIWQYEMGRVKAGYAELQQTYNKEQIRSKQQVRQLQNQILSKEQAHKESLFKVQQQLYSKQTELQELKRDLLKASDHVQELQSQQRIMLTKYNSLKDENKELEERLLLLRSAEIKTKPSVEVVRSHQFEGHSQAEVQKYRKLLQESERKIALQQKDLHDRADLIKRFQAQQSIKGYELEKVVNKVTEWTQRANNYQEALKESERYGKEKDRQIKKLNENLDQVGAALNHEKQKVSQYLAEKQEQSQVVGQLTHQIQKLKDEIGVIRGKLADSESQLKGKLQSTKVAHDKLLLELKDLRQKGIALNSQIQLKKFMVRQGQIAYNLQRQAKLQLQGELDRKKLVINKLNEQVANIKTKCIELEQRCITLQEQKDALAVNFDKNKQVVSQLKTSMVNSGVHDQVASLERQIDKLRSDKVDTEQYYERQLSDLKNMLKESKRMDNSRVNREQELKRKVKTLQKLIQNQNFDAANEKKKFLQEIERERRDTLLKVPGGQSPEREGQIEKSSAAIKANSLKLRYQKESDRLNKEIQELNEQLSSRDFIIKNQQFQFDNLSQRFSEVTAQLNKAQMQLEQERARYKQQQLDLQAEIRLNKQKLSRIQEQSLRVIVDSIDKKMSRLRTKKLQSSASELQKTMWAASYRQLSDILGEVSRQQPS